MIYCTINQHWSGNCLVLNSQHIITGTNDDSFQCTDAYLHHLASMVKSDVLQTFFNEFSSQKKCNFEYNFTEVSSYWSSWHYMFGSGIGLATVTSHYLNQWWQDFCHYMVSTGLNELTHHGLVMSNGNSDLGQLWLRKWSIPWWHQAITWIRVH